MTEFQIVRVPPTAPKPPERYTAPVGAEVKTRHGVFPDIPMVKQADGSWKPKY